MLEDFEKYMLENLNVSPTTVSNYKRGFKIATQEMLEFRIVDTPVENMTLSEFEIAMFLTLNNPNFKSKDSKGHRMYSQGLKQYLYFLKNSTVDNAEKIINDIKQDSNLKQTEKESIIKSRIGQGSFRNSLITKYNKKCVITGIADTRLLIASHIKPWSISSNENRLSSENGLLLNALYDKMFDLGLISFNAKGNILISKSIKKENLEILKIDTSKIYDLKPSKLMLENLEYHRDNIFIN